MIKIFFWIMLAMWVPYMMHHMYGHPLVTFWTTFMIVMAGFGNWMINYLDSNKF